METPSILPPSHQPVRSISLPTRTHPSSQRVEALLNHLKPIQNRSISTTNYHLEAETIQNDLLVLSDLYNSMKELLQSSQTQQSLLRFQNGKLVEEALCGSVVLLDACEAARDLVSGLRENVKTLQSALRRRRGDSSVESSVSGYVCFRKKASKEISKQIMALKRMENKGSSFSSLGEDQSLMFLERVLRETRSITISVFRSVLLFLCMKRKGSSLISKLKHMRLFSSEKEHSVDDLCAVLGRNRGKDEVEGGQRMLETLSVSVDCVEGGLDCIFKSLVQNRVCFLNML